MKTEEKRKVTLLDGKEVDCIVLHGLKKSGFLGRAKGKTILLSNYLFNEYSKDTQDFVMYHEYMHTKSSLVDTIWFGLAGVSVLLVFVGLSLLGAFEGSIGMSLLMVLMPIATITAIKWPIEGRADYYAIKCIGREAADKAIKELAEKRRMSIRERIENRITHPRKEWSLKLYDLLNPTGR